MVDEHSFGELLRQFRKQREETQAALAEQVHVARQTLNGWENDVRVPARDMVVRLAQALGLAGNDTNALLNAAGYVGADVADMAHHRPGAGAKGLAETIGGRLSYDVREEVRGFLELYLGRPGRKVPFGGRTSEFDALTNWLSRGQEPYLLLTAPAGRGKSALLVRWAERQLKRLSWDVIFVPISLRAELTSESHTYQLLAQQLAAVHGMRDSLPRGPVAAEVWKATYRELIARPLPKERQLLIILDGLDEAGGGQASPTLLPREAGQGLRAIVSARSDTPAPWLERLRWREGTQARCVSVPPLTEDGVADVLQAMGDPLAQLPQHQVDLVRRLWELSEGDPFIVELYVYALLDVAVEAFTPAALAALDIQRGLKGFFQLWWRDQERLWQAQRQSGEEYQPEAIETMLNTLALALGRLRYRDLEHLLPERFSAPRLIRQATGALRRLVSGDGEEQGFVFTHPRLNSFFQDEMGAHERRRTTERFLQYGRDTLGRLKAGALPPDGAPPYVLRYYGTHLDNAGFGVDSADYYALVARPWMEAWYRHEGTYAGFLNDVYRAWSRADAAGHIGVQIRCAVCRAGIVSLGNNIEPELLKQLVENGVWTPIQAVVLMQQLTDEGRLTKHLQLVTPVLPAAQQRTCLELARGIQDHARRVASLMSVADLFPSERQPILQAALAAALAIEEEWYRADVLSALAPHLPHDVLSAALAIEEEWYRADVLRDLATHLPHDVLAAALAIEEEWYRADVLRDLAPYLPEEQRATALQAALAIGDEESRADVLRALAPHLPHDVLSAALAIGHERYRAHVLSALAPHLPHDVLAAALAIEEEWHRADALRNLAPHLPHDVLAAALAIGDEKHRADVLSALAPHLPEEQRVAALQAALSAALAIGDEWSRAHVLSALAPHLPEEQSAAALQAALSAALAIGLEGFSADVLRALAPHLPHDVLAAALTIGAEKHRAHTLSALAPHLPHDVLAAALAIGDEGFRADVLSALAPHLPEEQRATALQAALSAALAIGDEESRADVLSALAPHLPEEQRAAALQAALSAALAIEDEEFRADVLHDLAPHLPHDVLSAALAIGDEGFRARVLSDLAPHLPHDVLSAALAIGDEGFRARVLSDLAPHLPHDVLSAALTIEDEEFRARVLSALAPHLPHDVLSAALAIGPERYRAHVLSALAPHLPHDVLAAALAIEEEWHRADALRNLAPHLPEEQRATALQAALDIGDEESRADVLSALAPHLPHDILAAALAIWDKKHRAHVLSALAPHLPHDALAAALAIGAEKHRAHVLSALAPHLPHDVLSAALAIGHERYRAHVLSALAPHLPEEQRAAALQAALSAALAIGDEESRADVLRDLAPHLPEEQRAVALQVALAAALAIWEEESCARVLSALAPHLPHDVLSAAPAIGHERFRADVLRDLAPHLPPDVLAATPAIGDERYRADVLSALAPALATHVWAEPEEMASSWKEANRALSGYGRPGYLSSLAALMPFVEALVTRPTSEPDEAWQQILEGIGAAEWWP